ncbi:hypothetical protein K491DRAFT_688817 [Lophiostoma macrostomum CBS 122681]|uniref:Secreted protein n=1 Tax=Lophiostoma macrostomum CBS 122681 TaxID=1314788 RepID=A0A6A6TIV4_9PLEO|nr:hypothetical protein K491DRAFT_688817 [Lophiostoma macrostomum CBS 122681]
MLKWTQYVSQLALIVSRFAFLCCDDARHRPRCLQRSGGKDRPAPSSAAEPLPPSGRDPMDDTDDLDTGHPKKDSTRTGDRKRLCVDRGKLANTYPFSCSYSRSVNGRRTTACQMRQTQRSGD